MRLNFYACAKPVLAASFFLAFLCVSPVRAQQLLGLSSSNFAGTNSIYTNPSSIADARHAFYLNLFTADVSITNDYFSYDGPYSPLKFFTEDIDFELDYLKENKNGKNKLLYGSTDVRGPSFMMRLSPKHSFGVSTRFRAGVQVNNLSEDLARLVKIEDGGAAEDLINQISENNTFNFNANAYAELGFTYARVLVDQGKHFIKAGFTLKRLAGGYSAYFNNAGTKFRLVEETGAGADADDYVLEIDQINAQYGYLTEDALEDISVSDVANMFTDGNIPGKGWGGDIGFTYEYRPKIEKYRFMMDGEEVVDEQKNKYKFRIGVSLLDVGSIKYKNANQVSGYNVVRENVRLRLSDFDGASDTDEFAEVLRESFNVTDADKISSFTSSLPTALNINVDYHLAGPLYINTTLVQGLKKKDAIGMRQNSLLAVTPRAEMKALELAFPIALQNNYSIFTVGAMVKLGPLFIGSDNIGGAFNMGDPYGANLYAGLSLLPLLKKNKKDKDKDGVSNKKDQCKTVPGTWALMGCPPSVNTVVVDTAAAPAGNDVLAPPADSVRVPVNDSLRLNSPESTVGLQQVKAAEARLATVNGSAPAAAPGLGIWQNSFGLTASAVSFQSSTGTQVVKSPASGGHLSQLTAPLQRQIKLDPPTGDGKFR